ncbi:MAG: hypothetical protein HY735_35590 [Verrucomicrobia bacterium]|nr:hypothetical protein [Verrucomicrobiota bacterium]
MPTPLSLPLPSLYNFVPLADQVFFPPWWPQVSHDVPFREGLCGSFTIEAEAMTPIYVRAKGNWQYLKKKATPEDFQPPPDDYTDFFKLPDDTYAIPDTSVKGVIRAVLEIASFGKLERIDAGKRPAGKDGDSLGYLRGNTQNDSGWDYSLDLAETIFGRVKGRDAGRGRVAFDSLRALESPQPLSFQRIVLGQPKGKYAPTYLKQTITDASTGHVAGGLTTYGKSSASLRGWKRYPVPQDGKLRDVPDPPPLDPNVLGSPPRWDLASHFRPLPPETRFDGQVRIHNLLPVELGALVWVLEWGGDERGRKCWHNLGLAKPYGFGCVRCTVIRNNVFHLADRNAAVDLAACRAKFEQCMDHFTGEVFGKKWSDTPQLRTLLDMADPTLPLPGSMEARYPRYSNDENKNEFQRYAQGQYALLPYGDPTLRSPEEVSPTLAGPPSSDVRVTPPPEPPKPLPELTGQIAQVSFLRREGNDLIFRLKHEKEPFDAWLRKPQHPRFCGEIKQGAAFKLQVIGTEGNAYILSEVQSP